MEDVKEKRCPFRVCKVEHPAVLRGQGATVTEEFYDCMGKECAAYYNGGCMRLIPPALVVNGEGFTDADIEKLREDMRNAPLMAAPSTEPSVEVVQNGTPKKDCSNCAVVSGEPCEHCTVSNEPGAVPSHWEPKEEVPW